MKFLLTITALLLVSLLPAQTLPLSRIYPGHQKNSPLHIINEQADYFYVLRYNRSVHDFILEKRTKPSAELLQIYPLKLDSVNASWFDYEQLDYLLFSNQKSIYFVFEKVLNNESALYMKVLDSTGVMSGFIPVYFQKIAAGSQLRLKFTCDELKRLQIVSELSTTNQIVRKSILLYEPALRKMIAKFILPLENAFTGYSQGHVISERGDLYYLQSYQELMGYERRYTAGATVAVPRLQTDTIRLVRISAQQVLKKKQLPAPLLSNLHVAKIIPSNSEVFFLMHATPVDSVPFFYLSRLSADLNLIDYIHTENLNPAFCKMLKYYDGSDDNSPGGKLFRLSAFSLHDGKATIWEERSDGNYHREILMWQTDLKNGRLISQHVIPRKLFYFPNRTYFRQLNQFMRIGNSTDWNCFLLENRANKREAPQDYHHRRFEKQTQVRHGALVQYQLDPTGIKKRVLFENADFDFVPVRYWGWDKDVVFYFNSGRNERFAILKDYRF